MFFEGVGDVLEEDQAEDDVFVLGGIHAAAEGVGHGPQLGLVADGCTAGRLRLFGLSRGLFASHPACSSEMVKGPEPGAIIAARCDRGKFPGA